ncbi:DUF3558 domain-containing protein [Actinokineospora inagensis]|uniref:DUF3558 domain-containing protein n=1 Tax=Actinokineospora inagensis TaxID=103730 RepID=UPI001FE18521|nr:DUF3558 domain-containing protein [Actinokineospora inagensis]
MVTGALLIVTGCTARQAGTPVPGNVVATPPASPSTHATSTSAAKPCDWLSGKTLTDLGITSSPRPKETKGATSCSWRVEKATAADSYTIDITYYQKNSLDDMVGDQPRTPVRVGTHNGVQTLDDTNSGCVVAMGTSATSRVDVYIIDGPQADWCKTATTVATLIEPRLP